METRIITKFTVVTEQGMDVLLSLTRTIATEKFLNLLDPQVLEDYITTNFNKQNLLVEGNSMSNQWLVVYADDEPAGYARISSKGKRPERLDRKRIIRIADFGVLRKFSDPAIRQSLFEKCMSVCKAYEAVWINEYPENPLIGFFETKGFVRAQGIYVHDELPIGSVCMIKEQD